MSIVDACCMVHKLSSAGVAERMHERRAAGCLINRSRTSKLSGRAAPVGVKYVQTLCGERIPVQAPKEVAKLAKYGRLCV